MFYRAAALAFFIVSGMAAREVAITLDDLPVAQSGANACELPQLNKITTSLLRAIESENVPVTVFVVPGNCARLSPQEFAATIQRWQRAGAEIGNHTFSHRSLTSTPVREYTADILKADGILRQITGRPLRFFRSPMLHTGADPETKRHLERFLGEHGYLQAPVTIDNSDWLFANAYARSLERRDREAAARVRREYIPYLESVTAFFEARSVEVVGREFPQIMLLHANRLNAEALPGILTMFRRRGYRFVSLEEALRDEAYQLPNEYAGKGGFSWIHRWSMTKGMPPKGEPDEPAWVRDLAER
ncbi:MAG: polysaccharide deacetylase family protein [Bryobacteraceae bacterium]|nr:polysaccharide deacetylase family protein [Bryobacteraceae bacterium]